MIHLFRRQVQPVIDQQTAAPQAVTLAAATVQSAAASSKKLLKVSPNVSELSRNDFEDLLDVAVGKVERDLDLSKQAIAWKEEHFVKEGLAQATNDTLGWVNQGVRQDIESATREQLQKRAEDTFSQERFGLSRVAVEVRAGKAIFGSNVSIQENVYNERVERYALSFDRPIEYPALVRVPSSKGDFTVVLSSSSSDQSVEAREGTFKGEALLIPEVNASDEVSVSKVFLIGHRF